MGCSFTAYTVIGCRLFRDKLYSKVKVKTFDNGFGKNINFDPDTGVALWREDEVAINGQDCIEDSFGEFAVCIESNEETDYIFVGLICKAKPSYDLGGPVMQSLDKLDLDTFKQSLKNYLSEFNIWNEDEYGLWTVAYVSC